MAPAPTFSPCPICGSPERVPYYDRPEAACAGCGSLERQRELVRNLRAELTPVQGRRCLEIAPYNARVLGEYLRALGWRYESIDKRAVRGARDPGAFDRFIDHDLDLADLRGLESGAYELVTLQHVLAEIPDDRAALDEIARVLAPGGRALLEIPWNPKAADTVPIDRDQYGNRRAYGRDVVAQLEQRFAAVELRELEEGMYRGTVFVCRAAQARPSPGRVTAGVPLRSISIDDIASVVTVRDPSWTGTSTVTAISRGAGGRDHVQLDQFPIIGNAVTAERQPQLRRSNASYTVRRIFMMSIPSCSLVGPHLVAVQGDRTIEQTLRGPSSFANERVFARGGEGWPALRAGLSSTTIDEPVVALGARAIQDFFCWMTELVPRLLFVRERGTLAELPVILRPVDTAFAQTTLQWLGVEPRYVEEDVVHVQRAVTASFPIHPAREARYSPEIVTLAQHLRDHYAPPVTRDLPRRFYISRRDARFRHVANEDALEERLSELGFTTVVLSEFEFAEQIAMFAGAEFVVAQDGGGLANLLFARPGTRVVELFPAGFEESTSCWAIASLGGLRYQMLVGDPVDGPRARFSRADIVVDIEQLTQLIETD